MVISHKFRENVGRRALLSAVGLAVVLGCGSAMAEGKTRSFAVTSWLTASYETPDGKEECPQGFALDAVQVYLSTLTPAQQKEFVGDADVGLDPRIRRESAARGPNGENVCWNPSLVKDPPLRTMNGPKGFGMNLDGDSTGKKTANTCAHKNLRTPDGKITGIDNQWARIVGCAVGWRRSADGYMEMNARGELRDNGHALLIEVSGIDDMQNDNDVTVNYYQANETLVKDSTGTGEILSGASFHPIPGFNYTVKGRLVNGRLTTEQVDFNYAFSGNAQPLEYYIRGMRVQLDIAADGRSAKGMIGGYLNLANVHEYFAKMGYLAGLGHFSCPAMYAATNELADGYPDPVTGKCTALSTAFNIEAVGAHVMHDNTQNAKADGVKLSQAER
jgi:hypothetical protein